jgi:hypothetical protein
MKANIFLVLFLTVLISSCGRESGKRAKIARNPIQVADNHVDTVVVTPFKIGVSVISENPECTNSECCSVSYTIGVLLKGENESRSLETVVISYSSAKVDAMDDPKIKKALASHTLIKSLNADDVLVTLVKNKVVKVASKEIWVDKLFIPSKTIWQLDSNQ